MSSAKCKKCGKKKKNRVRIHSYSLPSITEKRALLILGQVAGSRGHISTAKRLKKLLMDKYFYTRVDICDGTHHDNVLPTYRDFMNFIQRDQVQGLISYVGHGSQFGPDLEQWDYGPIRDKTLSYDLSKIGTDSNVIVIADSCFSDGMLDIVNLQNDRATLGFLSSARSIGPDDTRSAMFDSEGGYMTHNLCDVLSETSTQLQTVYERLTDRYLHLPGENLHIPMLTIIGKNKFMYV